MLFRSGYVDELDQRYPERRFIYFSGPYTGDRRKPGDSLAVTTDLRGTMRRAGEMSADLLTDDSGREDSRVVVLRLGVNTIGEQYASEFIDGLEGAGFAGSVQRLVIESPLAEGEDERNGETGMVQKLRASGVGSADFVWIWGREGLPRVLSLLEDWGVSSCAVGAHAQEAFPGTVALSVVYDWKEALAGAVARAESTPEAGSTEVEEREARIIRMEGSIRRHR